MGSGIYQQYNEEHFRYFELLVDALALVTSPMTSLPPENKHLFPQQGLIFDASLVMIGQIVHEFSLTLQTERVINDNQRLRTCLNFPI